jgi:hypothetical protein
MISVRRAGDRGRFDFGWLDTRHSFAFGHFRPGAGVEHGWGFRALRVINEDVVAPGRGFGEHPHQDMEIISYVVSGELAHRDSTGTVRTIGPGAVQRMSAGSGVEHSEFNPSDQRPAHFLQIWIRPAEKGVPASYEDREFSRESRRDVLRLIAAPVGAPMRAEGGGPEPVRIHQDARVYATLLSAGKGLQDALGAGRHAWVQVVSGAVTVNGTALGAGDGAALSDEPAVNVSASSDAELLVFDLA